MMNRKELGRLIPAAPVLAAFLAASAGTPVAAAPRIELEHTFIAESGAGGGSSWGTDDSLRSALEIPEDQLPDEFRQKLGRPAPRTLRVSGETALRGLFDDDSMHLYTSLNLCVDRGLDISGSGFAEALERFSRVVSATGPGTGAGSGAIEVRVLRVDRGAGAGSAGLRDCDVLAFQALPGGFPFSRLPEARPSSLPDFPRMVMGLFYRHSPAHLPVIVFHPAIRVDFGGSDARYFRADPSLKPVGQVGSVDGRTLFFHELGHLLGFAHVDWGYRPTRFVESASVMGLNNSIREEIDVQLRFLSESNVWKNWEPRQTSFYRSWLARYRAGLPIPEGPVGSGWGLQRLPVCLYPGEPVHFRLGLIFSLYGIRDSFDELPLDFGLPSPEIHAPRFPEDERRLATYALTPSLQLGVQEFRKSGRSWPALRLSHLFTDVVKVNAKGHFFSIEGTASTDPRDQASTPVDWFSSFSWNGTFMPIWEKVGFMIRPDLENCYPFFPKDRAGAPSNGTH